MLRQILSTSLFSGLVALSGAAPARAHAFGARYDLPLPLAYYLSGAASAVALTFLIMTVVFRSPKRLSAWPTVELHRFVALRVVVHPIVGRLLSAGSVVLFLVILIAGLYGTQETTKNFAPTFVWIIWWVGFVFLVAFAGNTWPTVNPWTAGFNGFSYLAERLGLADHFRRRLPYPAWLGVWPAILLFYLFAWLELVFAGATEPVTLAKIIVLYSVITWLGMWAFGRDLWLAKGEAFSVAFGLLGRFALIGRSDQTSPELRSEHWCLRPFGAGLVVTRAAHSSMTLFALLMLSTVTFDGFMETPLWSIFMLQAALEPSYHPLRLAALRAGLDPLTVIETVMLAGTPLIFFLGFQLCSAMAKTLSGAKQSSTEIAGLFVFSLVPISIAYHVAHYLSYLLVAGQRIIPLASDPLGFGWDLFGTATYQPDIAIVGAKFVWHMALVAIIAGHALAVVVAHSIALRVFETGRAAIRSQYPFLALMIAYTIASLWILSQPIVENPDFVALNAPSGMLKLTSEEVGEVCVDIAAGETIRYDFRSDNPIRFDIHYHEGTTVLSPVLINSATKKSLGFTADRDQSYCLTWTNPGENEARIYYRVARP